MVKKPILKDIKAKTFKWCYLKLVTLSHKSELLDIKLPRVECCWKVAVQKVHGIILLANFAYSDITADYSYPMYLPFCFPCRQSICLRVGPPLMGVFDEYDSDRHFYAIGQNQVEVAR